MGLLSGGLEAIFGAALGGLYLDATLHRDTSGPIYDDEGSVTGFAGGAGIACKAQVDSVTYAMRQAEGFVEGDVRIIVLSAGLGVAISTDMQITVSGQRWQIASVDRDAGASHWICRGRPA
jgi:hypothetical protein